MRQPRSTGATAWRAPAMAMLSFEKKYRVRGGTLIGATSSISGSARSTSASSGSRRPSSPCSHGDDRLRRRARSHLERLADLDRAARPEIRPRFRAAEGRRDLADRHRLRPRCLRLLGAARGGDLPQARHGLSRALRLRRRDLRLFLAGGDRPVLLGLGARLSPTGSSVISTGSRTSVTSTSTSTTIPRT